jgi:hypothetical protein
MTCRFVAVTQAPHAATTSPAPAAWRTMNSSFSGPTGSVAANMSFGFVALKAKRFTIVSDPQPARWANPTHFRIVGSGFEASATLGFNIRNTQPGLSRSHTRRRS